MIRCPQCNRSQPDTVAICDCGYDLETYRQQLKKEARLRQAASRPYRWLAGFRALLWAMGVLTIAGGVIGAIVLAPEEDDLWRPLLLAASSFIFAVPYFAFAEAIALLLALNARQIEMQETLRRIQARQEEEKHRSD